VCALRLREKLVEQRGREALPAGWLEALEATRRFLLGLQAAPLLLWAAEGRRDPPEPYASALPDEPLAHWDPAPLMQGDWSSLTGEPARRYLDTLASLLAATGDTNLLTLLADGIRALRVLDLPFYGDWQLCEARLVPDTGPGTLAFLCGPRGGLLLSGASDAIHRFNLARELALASDDAYLAYGRFFCSVRRGKDEEDRFHVIDAPEEIPWLPEATAEQVAAVGGQVHPMRLTALEDGVAIADACILNSNAVFQSRLRIQATGEVEMTDDETVGENLPVRREAFEGPLRFEG